MKLERVAYDDRTDVWVGIEKRLARVVILPRAEHAYGVLVKHSYNPETFRARVLKKTPEPLRAKVARWLDDHAAEWEARPAR